MKKTKIGISLLLIILALGCPEPTIFTVTFDSQGGSTVADATATELKEGMGALVAKPTPDPTKKDATFLGWYKEAEGKTLWNFDSDLVKANITLFAKWQDWDTVVMPTISPASGIVFKDTDRIPLSTTTEGAEIRYTTDGSVPTETSTLYSAPFTIGEVGEKTISAIAIKNGMINSNVATATFTVTEETTVMKFVQGGEFTMGLPEDDLDADAYEKPAHPVTLSSFYMGEKEVTQEEYEAIFGANSVFENNNSVWDDSSHPVNYVNWFQAIAYCNKLSIKNGLTPVYSVEGFADNEAWEKFAYNSIPTGGDSDWEAATCDWEANGYRLPTEAEWEYAAKGGSVETENFKYPGSDNLDLVAWYNGNSDYKSRPVGGKEANALELHDMSGNVYEWCWDRFDESYYDPLVNPENDTNPRGPASGNSRVLRGGAFNSASSVCGVGVRSKAYPEVDIMSYGFRLVRSAVQ